jgi:hypothetical protein
LRWCIGHGSSAPHSPSSPHGGGADDHCAAPTKEYQPSGYFVGHRSSSRAASQNGPLPSMSAARRTVPGLRQRKSRFTPCGVPLEGGLLGPPTIAD